MNIILNKPTNFNVVCDEETLQILRYACIALNEIGIWNHTKKEDLDETEIKRDEEIRLKAVDLIHEIQNALAENEKYKGIQK